MPNNQLPDYVAPHKHATDDVNLSAAFPPTLVAVPTTASPTNTGGFAVLPEMTLTFTPSTYSPLWQATIRFNGEFAHTVQYGEVAVKLQQDGVDITNTERSNVSADANAKFVLDTQATVLIPGGTSVTFRTMWDNATGSGTASNNSLRRDLQVLLTPYNPSAV